MVDSGRHNNRAHIIGSAPDRQLHHNHQISAKPANTQFEGETALLLGGIHTQETHHLTLASLASTENVQPLKRAKARTHRLQRTAERRDIGAALELFKCLVHRVEKSRLLRLHGLEMALQENQIRWY